jgi:hypothetical protein
MHQASIDCHGSPLVVGDSVKVVEIPAALPQGLPDEDQIAIRAQIGKTLIIQEFNEGGDAELEFADSDGTIHTIWIELRCLEKV